MEGGEKLFPLLVFLLLLASVFLVEFGVLAVMPFLVPEEEESWLGAVVDSCLLTFVVAPLLWGLIIRPLQRLVQTRTRLLARLLTAQEDERKRIAHDLHDEIGQSLTALLVGLRRVEDSSSLTEAQERLRELRQATGQTLQEVQRLARGLRPALLDDLGLGAALERFTADFAQASGLQVEMHLDSLKGLSLSKLVEIAIFRIVQEAMANVAKHAQAGKVRLVVTTLSNQLQLLVADDGCGFDPAAIQRGWPGSGGLGLSNMRERAALVGGYLHIETAKGQGTRVLVTIPLGEKTDGQNPCVGRG